MVFAGKSEIRSDRAAEKENRSIVADLTPINAERDVPQQGRAVFEYAFIISLKGPMD